MIGKGLYAKSLILDVIYGLRKGEELKILGPNKSFYHIKMVDRSGSIGKIINVAVTDELKQIEGAAPDAQKI